ncbi:MAG: hypothetical protein AAF902_26570 [Chloroflexota bacterium]
MHSSDLRGKDFKIFDNGNLVEHADFFSNVTKATRVGIYAPTGTDGVGATALIMAYVTAFYDTYRAKGEGFFAYPSFYTFQHVRPLSSYTMLDIWPRHKDVWVESSPVDLLNAINDRAINILLLPEQEPTNPSYEKAQLETALQTIHKCYLYSADGVVTSPTLKVTVNAREVVEWTGLIFNDHDDNPIEQNHKQKQAWLTQYSHAKYLTQSFRQISVEEALARL